MHITHDINEKNKRAYSYAETILKAYEVDESVVIQVNKKIPEHAGLGSGTQLALSIGMAISKLFDLNLSLMDVGKVLDRGNRSGIGIGAFENGGFLIDGGKGKSAELPPITVRQDFPENWRIILLINSREKGIHGQSEYNAFKTLKPFPENLSEKLCRLVNLVILPSLIEKNFKDFSSAIGKLQKIVGTHFSPIQGGVYSNPDIANIMSYVEKNGFMGVGQSSWGPTGFILTDSDTSAHKLTKDIRQNFLCKDLQIEIIQGRNKGSCIEFIDSNTDNQNKNLNIHKE
jgi:beta-RFAP synthase